GIPKRNNGIINIKNEDDHCFEYCNLAELFPAQHNRERVSWYTPHLGEPAQHYCLIQGRDGLGKLAGYTTKHCRKLYVCDYCVSHRTHDPKIDAQHMEDCEGINTPVQRTEMPKEDSETLSELKEKNQGSKTTAIQEHKVISFNYIIKRSDGKTKAPVKIRGDDPAGDFIKAMEEENKQCQDFLAGGHVIRKSATELIRMLQSGIIAEEIAEDYINHISIFQTWKLAKIKLASSKEYEKLIQLKHYLKGLHLAHRKDALGEYEVYQPTRYASEDSDSEFEEEASTEYEPPIIHFISSKQESKLQVRVMMIGACGGGNVFLASVKGKKLLGTILLPEIDLKGNTFSQEALTPIPDKNCFFYTLESDPSVIVVPCNYDVNDDRCFVWTKSLFQHVEAECVIILDVFTASSFITSNRLDEQTARYPPFVRLLQTSAANKTVDAPSYEAPNLARNLTAAILNHCEIRNTPAYALFSIQDSRHGKTITTYDTLEAYKSVLSLLLPGTKLLTDVDRLHESKRASPLYL
ncbi:5063_t:CDS:2, partial [Paraglomus occultum]